MSWSAIIAVFLGTVVLSALLTEWVRRFAEKRGIRDVPNARSSHDVPTPRGGGLTMVMLTCVGLIWLLATDQAAWSVYLSILIGGVLVGAVGFIDDIRSVGAAKRFMVHSIAALSFLLGLGAMPTLDFGLFELSGVLAIGWMVLYIIWFINLYNFMDGIDGIAGIEALSISLPLAILSLLHQQHALSLMSVVVGASSLGFLFLNWSPAKIFMGDIGSGFLGFMLGVLGLLAVQAEVFGIIPFLILSGVFVIDATYTLLRRAVAGQRVYQAHRTHAYQQATKRGLSHGQVSTIVFGINLCWLMPLAFIAHHFSTYQFFIALVAFAPLIGVAVYLRAGMDD